MTKLKVWIVALAFWYLMAALKYPQLFYLAIIGGAVAGVVFLLKTLHRTRSQGVRDRKIELALARAREEIVALCEVVRHNFLVGPCNSCGENGMRLLEVSPNAKSVRYQCLHCKKTMRALAGTPSATSALGHWTNLLAIKSDLAIEVGIAPDRLITEAQFATVAAPLPYEQTSRENIPAALRAEVWRRDQGRCVECHSIQNLQFDHIIPIARGGATSAANLQLLCRQHNLAKHSSI